MQRTTLILALLLASANARAAIEIGKVHGAVTVDGDLSDSGWKDAVRIDRFYETIRGENAAPPVRTVARMAYDAKSLYIAFEADDPHPGDIRAPLVDRDKVLTRIPLSSLRYPAADPQTWGVILMRNYPREFRYAMSSAPIPKSSNCFVCHADTLTGLSGLPDGGHMTVAPYATASRDEPGSGAGGVSGLDLKWSPGTRMTIDGTLNPDFSQIEADVPQFTVGNRFALDYPEKRPFFLEGVDLLATPIRAVYTRSIASPAWGIRTTGESGTTDYTLLLAGDRGGGTLILPSATSSDSATEDFRSRVLIGRVRHSIGDSFVGLLATAREVAGGGFNRVAGPDFLWKPNDTDRMRGQLLLMVRVLSAQCSVLEIVSQD